MDKYPVFGVASWTARGDRWTVLISYVLSTRVEQTRLIENSRIGAHTQLFDEICKLPDSRLKGLELLSRYGYRIVARVHRVAGRFGSSFWG